MNNVERTLKLGTELNDGLTGVLDIVQGELAQWLYTMHVNNKEKNCPVYKVFVKSEDPQDNVLGYVGVFQTKKSAVKYAMELWRKNRVEDGKTVYLSTIIVSAGAKNSIKTPVRA